MATQLTWYGHGTWLIDTGSHKILLDPFLDENPSSPIKAVHAAADVILLSHGHFDHVGLRSDGDFDVVEIAKRTGAQVVTILEMAQWINRQGVENAVGMNIGGTFQSLAGPVRMTQAVHSSSLPNGEYGGDPVGFILEVPEGLIYLACDTDLFSDMQLIGEKGILLAIVPIGDHYTMGVNDSIRAIQWISPKHVAPAHYDTWPPIAQDANAWAEKVKCETSSQPHVIKPGETITLN